MSVPAPHVVVINGPSSSGKSALAAELQLRLDDVWVRMSIDGFLPSLPLETHQMAIAMEFGTLLSGFHAAIAPTARAGTRDVSVDTGQHGPTGAAEQVERIVCREAAG